MNYSIPNPITEDAETLHTLEGTLERLTFQNEENGYTVAKLIPTDKSYEVTVVGPLTGVNVGESVRLRGFWTTHPKYGRQFEVRTYTVKLPATLEGLRKYLGSGLIKGIGPVNAGRIVDYFGLQTLDVIEEDVDQLREVPGIGPKRAAKVAQAWEEQKHIKEIMLFLQGHGVSTGLAVKIFKAYGETAIGIVRHDPYQLEKDIYGIGFKTADKIARQLGIAPDAPTRIQAGLRYVLGTFSNDGHCYARRTRLLTQAAQLLEVTSAQCSEQLAALVAQEEVIIEMVGASDESDSDKEGNGDDEHEAIYLPPFYYAERGVANKLRFLQRTPRDRLTNFEEVAWEKAFEWLDERADFRLAEQQQRAIQMALTEKVSILTGGPGTGKSTIVGSIIQVLAAKGKSVLLAAPTGRAAQRLGEMTGLEAKTIHRLLEFSPNQGNRFLKDRENPLDADILIVDEASMIDILLMNNLLKATAAGMHLLLVGDVDQLPSVGPGNVLRDLIASETIPVTRLQTIFRQAEDSYIVVNAHRINEGRLPIFAPDARDFFLFRRPDPDNAADWVIDIVAHRIPRKFGYDPQAAIQVLSPMHRGSAGVSALNRRLQETLNPPTEKRAETPHGSRVFRVGDRVMQIRNDYDRQVFNGDMGRIAAIDLEEQALVVDFAGAYVGYEFSQLDQLEHAYAVSIHKSQGSEFPAVVVPLLTQHYMMLQRNLLYTAITRARELVVLVGSRRAIAIAVHNDKIAHRNTHLRARLQSETPRETRGAYTSYG